LLGNGAGRKILLDTRAHIEVLSPFHHPLATFLYPPYGSIQDIIKNLLGPCTDPV
jgi:hypothetical protein